MSAFCSGCGAPLNGAKFCVKCGKPAEGATPQQPPMNEQPMGGYNQNRGYNSNQGYSPNGGGYRPTGNGMPQMNINFKMVSMILFWVGVLCLGIGALIQFITGMTNIGSFSRELKSFDASGIWILPLVILSLFGAAATAVSVLMRNHPMKNMIGAIAGGALVVWFIILYIVAQATVGDADSLFGASDSINGFTLLCARAVDKMAAIVTFCVIGAAGFIGSMVTERM